MLDSGIATAVMSFAAKFYSFSIDLNHVDRQVFTRFRLKVPLHPIESLHHFYARMIAYLNAYSPSLSFSQGLFDIKQPTIWNKDVIGDVLTWIQVGVPERKKLENALRMETVTSFQVYFYEPEQISQFCHQLRGSKTNWVKPITFYSLSTEFLDRIALHDRSSPEWSITFVDNHIYLICDGNEVASDIVELDIWKAFQETLQATV